MGKYNIKYRYHADYDYFFRMIVKKKKLKGMATKKMKLQGFLDEVDFPVQFLIKNCFMKTLKLGMIMDKIYF